MERVRAAIVRGEIDWRVADDSNTRLGVALVTALRIMVDDVVCEGDQLFDIKAGATAQRFIEDKKEKQ